MKKVILFLFLASLSLANAQVGGELYSYFENGTLEGWTNSDGMTTLLTVEDIPDPLPGLEDHMILQKICDGSQTPVGEMAIVYILPNPMSLNSVNIGGLFSTIGFIMRNQNDFNIKLNAGFKDSQGRKIVFDIVDGISPLPAFSDWNHYGNIALYEEPHYLDGSFDYSQVVEVKIFHNDNPSLSYDGLFVEGVLEIDEILPQLLLGVEDSNHLNIVLSPNPSQDKVTITSTTQISGYHIYDLSGKLVCEGIINDSQYVVDISVLTNGMYFIEITSDENKEVHKILKN